MLVAILQMISISLGVGSSTLAVLNFFTALKDGKIDETERNFMGVTYTVLRVAMVLILVSTAILAYFGYSREGVGYFDHYVMSQLILLAILYLNAILMTKHIVPSSVGPAIQASAWYTLGIIATLFSRGVDTLDFFNYILLYLSIFTVTFIVINSAMIYLKSKND